MSFSPTGTYDPAYAFFRFSGYAIGGQPVALRGPIRSSPFLHDSHLSRGKDVFRAAELAGDRDYAIFDHVIAVILGKALQHGSDAVPRARALRFDARRL